jgi:hypothetical protein
MKKIASSRTRLNLIGIVILLLGLSSAVLIYWRAENQAANVLGYDEGNGTYYPIMPDDSKKYVRGLELYGGKANVLADELRRWLEGLWHGQTLAFTIAFITIIISLPVFYIANHTPDTETHSSDETDTTTRK